MQAELQAAQQAQAGQAAELKRLAAVEGEAGPLREALKEARDQAAQSRKDAGAAEAFGMSQLTVVARERDALLEQVRCLAADVLLFARSCRWLLFLPEDEMHHSAEDECRGAA